MSSKEEKNVQNGGSTTNSQLIRFVVDYAFKKAMKNPKALRGLLAAILQVKPESIMTIRYLDTNTIKENEEDKLSILDLFVEIEDGSRYNLEMQLNIYHYWENRTLVNVCRKLLEPIKKGNEYTDDNIPKCIHIGILDFICKEEEPSFYNQYEIRNVKTGMLYSDRIAFHMIELPKLKYAAEEEKQTKLYRWSSLLAAKSWEEYDKVAKGDQSMEAAVEELKEIGSSPEEIRAYNNRMLALSDIATQTHAAREEGEKKARAEGIRAVIIDNIEEGKAEEEILKKLKKYFGLQEAEAKKYFNEFSVKNV